MAQQSNFEGLMASVGIALHGWAQTEVGLGALFTLVSGIPNVRQAGAIFDSIVDFRSRLAMLDAAFAHSNATTADEQELWVCVTARLRKLYKRRHEIAHFGIADPDLLAAQRISPFFTMNKFVEETQRYLTVAQILHRSSQFGDAGAAIYWFNRHISERVRPEKPFPGPDEEPLLIVRIRELLRRKQ
jgi:hypothetical protein